jgi:hypothetical protein
MMDGGFPAGPRSRRLTAATLVVGGVVGLLLFGGAIPGVHFRAAGANGTMFDGRPYTGTPFAVPVPFLGLTSTAPGAVGFRNVTLYTWVTNWSLSGGTYLHGNATEPNGTVYPFVLGGFSSQANWTDDYVAPAGAIVVLWAGGLTGELLVSA